MRRYSDVYLQSQDILVDAVLAEKVQAVLDDHGLSHEILAN